MCVSVQNFGASSSLLSLEKTFEFINAFHNMAGPIIRLNDGYIDKYLGPEFIALFKKNERALAAAIQLSDTVKQFNEKQSEFPNIRIAIGVHCGAGMIGIVGENERMESAVLSTANVVAQHLKRSNAKFKTRILASKGVVEKCKKSLCYRYIGNTAVQDVSEPIGMYEVFHESDTKNATKDTFTTAVNEMMENNVPKALELFAQVIQANATDATAQQMMRLCDSLKEIHSSKMTDMSLVDALQHASVLAAFEKFMIQEFNSENLMLYKALDQWSHIPDLSKPAAAKVCVTM